MVSFVICFPLSVFLDLPFCLHVVFLFSFGLTRVVAFVGLLSISGIIDIL